MLYDSQRLNRNADTFLTLEQTRSDKRFDCAYRPTFDIPGGMIDARHKQLLLGRPDPATGMIDIGIEGWLLPADAGKLYEMATFSVGWILEIGTFKGLSTSVLAEAVAASGRPRRIVTVDMSPRNIATAAVSMGERHAPGRENVDFYVNEGAAFLDHAIAQRLTFGFAFIDHAHRYDPVVQVIKRLPRVLAPGAFVLFHDYNDPRNPHEANAQFAVYQAVSDTAAAADLEFWGVFGCCGLFRYVPKG